MYGYFREKLHVNHFWESKGKKVDDREDDDNDVEFFYFSLLQYGKADDDKAVTTPLVKHAPDKEKKGKKDKDKDKLEDLKQELEMVA